MLQSVPVKAGPRSLLGFQAEQVWTSVLEDNGPEAFNPGFFGRSLLQSVRCPC